jgi:TRAP-type C4-dicarboxylate transport system permease small subunit
MLIRLNDAIARAFLFLAALLAFLLGFLVVADVLGRVVFNSPVKGTPEIVSTSIVFICFIQAGYAIRSGGMVNVNAFVKHLGPSAQSWMEAIGALLGMAFFGLICWTSAGFAITAWVTDEFTGEGALEVPTWPTRFAIVAGTALATTSYLITVVQGVRNALAGRAPKDNSLDSLV